MQHAPLSAKTDYVRLVLKLHGRAAAMAAMPMVGLPDFGGVAAKGQNPRGLACLRHLLDHQGVDGLSVLDMISTAFDADDPRHAPLLALGLRIVSGDNPGVLVAISALATRAIYRGTEWADGRHTPALRSLTGVRSDGNYKFATGVQSRALFVPLDLIGKA